MTTNKSNHSANDHGSSDWSNFIEAIALSLEDFMADIQQTVEEITESIQQEIGQEFEGFWQEFISPLLNLETEGEIHFNYENYEENWSAESDFWLNPKVEPTATFHPACIGCANYHGRLYNDNLLVCGMHPYGVESEPCKDWERS